MASKTIRFKGTPAQNIANFNKLTDALTSTPSPAEQEPLSTRVGGHSSWVAQSKESEKAEPEGFDAGLRVELAERLTKAAAHLNGGFFANFVSHVCMPIILGTHIEGLLEPTRPGLSGAPERPKAKMWVETHKPFAYVEAQEAFDYFSALERLLASALADADRLKGELEECSASELRMAAQRDEAESSFGDAYVFATGNVAEWSNVFGFDEATNEIAEVVKDLTDRAETAEAELSRLRGEVKEAYRLIDNSDWGLENAPREPMNQDEWDVASEKWLIRNYERTPEKEQA